MIDLPSRKLPSPAHRTRLRLVHTRFQKVAEAVSDCTCTLFANPVEGNLWCSATAPANQISVAWGLCEHRSVERLGRALQLPGCFLASWSDQQPMLKFQQI